LLLVIACSDPVPASQSRGETPLALDSRGLPRLLQGAPGVLAPAANASESARLHIQRLSTAWGVQPDAVPTLEAIGEVPVLGGTIARIRQVIDGMPVDDGELRLLVRGNSELLTASGSLVGTDIPRKAPAFVDDEAGAIARAVHHAYGVDFDRTQLVRKRGELRGGSSAAIDVGLASTRKVWRRAGDRLIAAWVVEYYASKAGSTNGDAFRTVISDSGRVLAHDSLVADAAFSYRVFAEATGEKHPLDGPIADPTPHATGVPNGLFPAFITPSLVSVDGLNATADPWLAAGKTETLGNNVDAYVDINAPSGLTAGDFRATTTAAGSFDRGYNTSLGPLVSQAQQMSSVVSLFYTLNWLHDFWYDAGFTETAGNGQASNYGRGGMEDDAVLGEAQDNANGGSRNNANMATPSDGMSPRMQVFLWTGQDERTLNVAGTTPASNVAAFGPSTFDISGSVVLANNGVLTDACTVLASAAGKIVLVDRGTCSFKTKALQVQNAGGIGMILADNVAAATPPHMGGDSTVMTTITIGSLSVTQAQGAAIKTALGSGAVNATLHRLAGTELDGAIDATLVAHEFGHYLHHRLQSCGTKMCGALSEGWGDFDALMLLARPGDNLNGAFPFAVYATEGFSDDPAYFGIRRAPYSVNPAINSLSFRHMAEGEALPTTEPFLTINSNSEIHNAGEIWASTMWEAYVALQQAGDGTFDEIRKRMQQYVVAGLLLAPSDGTPTETRDAILAAAFAARPSDHDVLVQAFARRGMGSCAVSPPRDSSTFVGIVESADVRGRALPGAAAFADSVTSCDDDGVLDAGETAHLKVPIANPGHVAVTDVVVTIGSPTPGITLMTPIIQLGTLAPYTSTDVEIDVALDPSVRDAIDGELTVVVTSNGSCDQTLNVPIKLRMNVDEVPESSATDSFDTVTTAWTTATDTTEAWTKLQETALDSLWHGADLDVSADTQLISPLLEADATEPVVVTFGHRYSFEFGNATAFDGGVIEISIDGSQWQDVTLLGVTPTYSATLSDKSGNPLGGRAAYTGDSPSYPAFDIETLDFGTQLAGMQFQLRFRIATDIGQGAPGWEIDDVAFSGIVGTPFPTVVPDPNHCSPEPGKGSGGCCDAGRLRTANVIVALGVLALLLRRRKR
jgi:hypothetical protein